MSTHNPTEVLKNFSENEKISLTLHPHPIIYFFLGLYLIGFFVVNIIFFSLSNIITNLIGVKLFWFFITTFWIIFCFIIFVFWVNFTLNILIIVDKKIIFIRQNGFLSKEIVEVPFEKIQEIGMKISGILPTIFHYGNITITTTQNSHTIRFIKNPQENIQKINEIIKNSTSQN